ncbi:MAG: aminotransferase class I/II-fold pyridoxal phosphate-dependent enzyme [Acidobacteria bacterium]|nr:aminotransferase class I/II-fold pyridoxal phosphate-dependent enzyme [Acidobacteriota bacterium]
MKLEPFALERYQSIWEHRVAWNLSESGVHPLRVADLVDTPELQVAMFERELGYPQTNGTIELRSLVAAMYPGAGVDHVEVTNGGSEANFVLLTRLVQAGDEIVFMTPNYLQARGVARALGANVREWPLRQQRDGSSIRWIGDLEALRGMVSRRTRAILLCNPNNPTGARLDAAVLDEVCRIAATAGAWVVSDEIYRGAEREADETPSVWGRYERAVVTSGLSKAYGLPGLRIGWVVGPPDLIADLWGIHDYTTIAPGAINDCLAGMALQPSRRATLLARTRGIIRANYPVLKRWIDQRDGLTHVPPEAGAIAFIKYPHPISSTTLTTRLRDEAGVLIVPGDHFEMDGYVRIGFGSEPTYLSRALEVTGAFLDSVMMNAR